MTRNLCERGGLCFTGAVKPLSLLALLLGISAATAQEPTTLRIDFAKPAGTIRALHGINKGPLAPGGIMDFTELTRALAIPHTRLHDCHWPNPDVVDFHAVFPRPEADPQKPESYVFGPTDEYVAAVRATGAQIVFRLGQSIEHTKIKRHVHPPKDLRQWTAIGLGIIRHYNEGWADGHRHGIRYWEIWNEPENRPVMWTGTDEQFLDLYATAAREIKKHDPQLLVGGPSFGASGSFAHGKFQPTEFVTKFLDRCQRESLPLDFFSWHCYTADSTELIARAKAIRQLLDTRGFTKTESHLNEWNFLPGNSWKQISKSATGEARQKHYEDMAGAPGAAFIAAALLELQDAPVDVGNLFHGEAGGFGIFNEHGVPMKNYYALLAFRDLLQTPKRVTIVGAVPGKLAAVAGTNDARTTATILVSNFSHRPSAIRLSLENTPWKGAHSVEVRVLNATQNLTITHADVSDKPSFDLNLPAPAVAIITLSAGGK
jgi:xylan 1,4-beta-xylosidase